MRLLPALFAAALLCCCSDERGTRPGDPGVEKEADAGRTALGDSGGGATPDGGGATPDGGGGATPDGGGAAPDAGGATPDAGGAPRRWPAEACLGHAPLPGWVEAGPDGRTFTARCAGVTLRLEVREVGVVRLRYAPHGGWERASSWAVLPAGAGQEHPVLRAVPDGDGLLLCTPLLAVRVAAAGCRLRVADARGTVLLEDPPGGGYFEGQEPLHGTVRTTVGVRRRAEAGEHFYGFGEKTGGLDRRGRTMVFWNRDACDSLWHGFLPDADPLYQSVPFFVGLRGSTAYGLFTDNTHYLRMEMAAAEVDPDSYRITAFGGAIDQYLLSGPSMAEVLRRYTMLTGRMPLPPRWTLGYHQSRWQDIALDRWVLDTTRQLRQRSIPADGIWLDINHMDRFRSFTWDPAVFPDPEGFLAGLLASGFRATIILDPGLHADPAWEVYADGLARGAFLRGADGRPYLNRVWADPAAFPDFSDPAVREWWAGLTARTVARGVHGLWIDMNEPTVFAPTSAGSTVPDELPAAGDGQPTTMAEVHNVYALLEAQATYEGMRRGAPDRRPFLLTRAGYAGVQRYAAVWTGDAPSDWAILEQTLAMLLGLGLSGEPFAGSDVGGYSGVASGEMFARWMQLGSFSPFFRGHTEREGNHQEPWSFGPEVEEVARCAIVERYRLLPYLYSLFHEATRSGAPMLRPLVWEFPEDERTHRLSGQAMLGPWLLFAPVLQRDVRAEAQGAPNFRLYLPAGRWFELRSSAIWEGPAEVELLATLGDLPTFVRAGAILPSTAAGQWSDQRPVDPLFLDLYPAAGRQTSFTLYEDDGLSLAHEQGSYSAVRYDLEGLPDGALLQASTRQGSFAPLARLLVVRVPRVDRAPGGGGAGGGADEEPAVAVADGRPLPRAASGEELLARPPGWWWDPDGLALVVALPDRPGLALRLRYDPRIDDPRPPVRVLLEVQVPPGTPRHEPIRLASSVEGWDPERHQLSWSDVAADTAHGAIVVPRGAPFFYKYTRGSWASVEKGWENGCCRERANRYAPGAAHPVRRDVVEAWSDRCAAHCP